MLPLLLILIPHSSLFTHTHKRWPCDCTLYVHCAPHSAALYNWYPVTWLENVVLEIIEWFDSYIKMLRMTPYHSTTNQLTRWTVTKGRLICCDRVGILRLIGQCGVWKKAKVKRIQNGRSWSFVNCKILRINRAFSIDASITFGALLDHTPSMHQSLSPCGREHCTNKIFILHGSRIFCSHKGHSFAALCHIFT